MPDMWEAEKLLQFEQDHAEVSEVVGTRNKQIFRFMAPLRVEESCLKCHRHQGYQLGDVRGGLSVTFALDSLLGMEYGQLRNIRITHFFVWLSTSLLGLLALLPIRQQMQALQTEKMQTEDRVVQRTTELRTEVRERERAEEHLQLFIDSSGEGILGSDSEGICTLVNPRALHMLGFDREDELLGKTLYGIILRCGKEDEA